MKPKPLPPSLQHLAHLFTGAHFAVLGGLAVAAVLLLAMMHLARAARANRELEARYAAQIEAAQTGRASRGAGAIVLAVAGGLVLLAATRHPAAAPAITVKVPAPQPAPTHAVTHAVTHAAAAVSHSPISGPWIFGIIVVCVLGSIALRFGRGSS